MGCDDPKPQYRVQSVYDALVLLDALVTSDTPLTASEAGRRCGFSRNRAFRLLKTLEEGGHVTLVPGHHAYEPTLKLMTLGQAVMRKQTIERIARPVMQEIQKKTGETVYMTAREGLEVVGLLTIQSTQMVRIAAEPGRRWPLGFGSAGEALLLGAPESIRNELLGKRPDIANRYDSIQSRFEREGVTHVDGRKGTFSDVEVMSIGAPIHDAMGNANHALAIAWPISRPAAVYEFIRQALLEGVQEIRQGFGLQCSNDETTEGIEAT